MSSYLRWTKHPETGHYHNAFWIDDHYGHHRYGVRFNDGKVFRSTEIDRPTYLNKNDIPSDELLDLTRDQYLEVFGEPEVEGSSSVVFKEPVDLDGDVSPAVNFDGGTTKNLDSRIREMVNENFKELLWINDKHEHTYTIPVEWQNKDFYSKKWGGGEFSISNNYIIAKRVTKLRCPCGEEIER